MNKYFIIFLFCFLALACTDERVEHDDKTIITRHDYLRDFPAMNNDGLVNVVVEIPAGCNQKWEVDKVTGFLKWERINDDSLRVVRYLPYPANYGMVPQTLLPIEEGGDNDPLDIFLLGLSLERGSVVPARVIGVIKMLDKGLQDDKLIAVPLTDLFSEIKTLQQLNEHYPGVIDLISIWLSSYKRGGKVEIISVTDHWDAVRILNQAHKEYLFTKN